MKSALRFSGRELYLSPSGLLTSVRKLWIVSLINPRRILEILKKSSKILENHRESSKNHQTFPKNHRNSSKNHRKIIENPRKNSRHLENHRKSSKNHRKSSQNHRISSKNIENPRKILQNPRKLSRLVACCLPKRQNRRSENQKSKFTSLRERAASGGAYHGHQHP